MTHYSVLSVSLKDDGWLEAYLPVVKETLARHGGRFLARTMEHEQVEGEAQPAQVRIIIEWPSREAAEAWMADPDYHPQMLARQAGTDSRHFLIKGQDDFA